MASTCWPIAASTIRGTSVILITGYGTVESAVEAIRAGAFDFLTKPLIDEELELSIERALNQRKVIEENKNLKAQLDLRFGMESIIGHDHRMLRIFEMIDSIADTKATVLITGESGTGKSLIARAIHRRSARREQSRSSKSPAEHCPRRCWKASCSATSPGRSPERPAIRSANSCRPTEGTIFLDEIGTASPGMQVKLLRVLQEMEFEQVGGNKTFHVDSRVILATNEDLSQAVAAGRFRQDLYYRVNVINIELPQPPRPHLRHSAAGQAFLRVDLAGIGQEDARLQRRRDRGLAALPLAGKRARAAKHRRAGRAAGQGRHGRRARFAAEPRRRGPISAAPAAGRSLKQALEAPERQIILEVLEGNNWNRHATAETLGINRTTLYKKMKRLGLEDGHAEAPLRRATPSIGPMPTGAI